MVAPLTSLLRHKARWLWTVKEQVAFEHVKECLCTAPVLAHPDWGKPFEVISDASLLGTGAVLLQEGRPVAFTSKKFDETESWYITTEQEHLGVIRALQEWRCYLEGSESTLITDHNSLIWLQTQPMLSRKQARWMELMSRFHYKWEYWPGRINVADPISRNPSLSLAQIFIAAVTTRGQTATRTPNVVPGRADLSRSGPKPGRSGRPRGRPRGSKSGTPVPPMRTDILTRVAQGYITDPWFAVPTNTSALTMHADGWYRNQAGQVMVPNNVKLKNDVIRELHSTPYSGHVGITKTFENVSRLFIWLGMRADIIDHVECCIGCQRNKPYHLQPAGLLQSLQIPVEPWSSVSMDFITQLPQAEIGYDSIAVFVCRLTKMAHFVPTYTTLTAIELAYLFLREVIKLHGVPKEFISDRDSKFTSKLWRAVCDKLGTTQGLSTSFHPQTDGQTERVNRVLEEMLRHYVSPDHTDWHEHLAMAEFA